MIRQWVARGLRGKLKPWMVKAVLIVVVMGVGGILAVVSGLIPIKASSGHWPITHWFLDFAKSRSVATHSLGIKTPPLDNRALILKGAGHYETGCRSCHGSPGLPRPMIAQRMTPSAPALSQVVPQREAKELFYVIKHGIKFTGMPAWPTPGRDDEIWAVVAFLRQYPKLSREDYLRLAMGETIPAEGVPTENLPPLEKVPQIVSQSCARCHGRDGQGRDSSAFPKLAGQKSGYLLASLQAYASSERRSGMMGPIAAGLSPESMEELARYYAELRAHVPPSEPRQGEGANQRAIERGKVIAKAGIKAQRVPACVACHGPSPTKRNPFYPLLAGQFADYLALQLDIFDSHERGGTAYSHLMDHVAGRLTGEQKRDVALYYESLGDPR